ncbi:MAG: hypothetical protein DME03_18590 [Candidatus Rokuibacteriota bacterium]|nr:MAG: hypothetical protein DME03_18590 [Candidatus Rokubacteria bacterium]
MAASSYARYAVLAVTTAGIATLLFGATGRRPESPDVERTVAFASARARDSRALTEEAIRLYAAGQFPRACEKRPRSCFVRA